jgi:hypothetical protein
VDGPFRRTIGGRPRFTSPPVDGKSARMDKDDYKLTPHNLMLLSDISLLLGFVSIAGSILTWFTAKEGGNGHRERSAIFVGLWVPSFFILSNRLARKSEELEG